jgi:purine-cytosine permease-like protein
VLVALLVGESDNAFANIYSSAVSVQNVVPEAPQRRLIVSIGVLAFFLALALSIDRYEVFLFLIGSVFVPLFGVFAAEYFVLRRGRFTDGAVFERSGVRWRALMPWAVGFVLYHWCVAPGTMPAGWTNAVTAITRWLHLPFPLFDARFGASLPSFVLSFALTLVILRPRATRSTGGPSAAAPRSAGRRRDPRTRS